ncbi:hypothetical protein EDM80_07610 [bacterium]|nr:MAG: hypothetical protein EDM80_07610 [bacterium]RIK64088.1 MAG: hypothetical protein DCC64_05090 [Planctomycetota bacterium]
MSEQARDRYLDAALREVVGQEAAPDLSGRILAAAQRQQPQRPRRSRSLPAAGRRMGVGPVRRSSATGPLLAALLVLAAFAAVIIAMNQPRLAPAPEGGAKANAPVLAPNLQEPAEIVPAPEVPPAKASPEPEAPLPDLPADPRPRPQPPAREEKPPAEVPPQPPARAPEGEVRRPESTEPPRSEERPAPEAELPRAVVATVKEVGRKNGLKLRYAESEEWRVVEAGEQLRAGARLRTTGQADLILVSGALARFDGEIALGSEEQGLELIDESLFLDNLDLPRVTVSASALSVVTAGMVLFEAGRNSLSISCLQGQVESPGGLVGAGKSATLTAKGLSRASATSLEALARKHAMLRGLPQRLLWREDFEQVPPERRHKGEVIDGVGRGEGTEAGVSVYLGQPQRLRKGDVLRMRLRVSRAPEELLLQMGTAEDGNYRCSFKAARVGEWMEMELPLTDLFRTLDKTTPIRIGFTFKNFQVWASDPRGSRVEVDWAEIVRRPSDE